MGRYRLRPARSGRQPHLLREPGQRAGVIIGVCSTDVSISGWLVRRGVKEIEMRDLILGMSMSLDGFVAGPNDENDWIGSGRERPSDRAPDGGARGG